VQASQSVNAVSHFVTTLDATDNLMVSAVAAAAAIKLAQSGDWTGRHRSAGM